jgi:hypothetical protein
MTRNMEIPELGKMKILSEEISYKMLCIRIEIDSLIEEYNKLAKENSVTRLVLKRPKKEKSGKDTCMSNL